MKLYKINEIVYLKNTMFDSYEFIAYDENRGMFTCTIKGHTSPIKLTFELYGDKSDNEIIIRFESVEFDDIDVFKDIMNNILHILNKNKLEYKFTFEKIQKDKYSSNFFSIMKSNKKCNIQDLEKVFQTTKIANNKVKNFNDYDKLIYLTK